jgi:probable HAF family extracellular repeat protein
LFYGGTRVVDLGTLGGSTAGAGDVNNAGQVVGASSLPGDPPGVPGVDPFTHAFLWSRNTGMIDLGTLGGTRSGAAAINKRGQVAGNSLVPGGDTHAFRWSPAFWPGGYWPVARQRRSLPYLRHGYYDGHWYQARHLIENFCDELEQYRALATRCGKAACSFLGTIYLAATVDWRN